MLNVLIIDDEEPLREAIRILGDWKGLGVGEVLEATNGKAGLAMLAEHRIDLAIIDMKMPEMDGRELLQVIEQSYPELLTIVVSGYNDFEYTRQAIHSKVVDYLLKPINRQDLNQALHKAANLLKAKRTMQSEAIHKNIALNMSLPKLKEKVYLSILERSFISQISEAMLPLIGADDKTNRFAAAAIRVLNLEGVAGSRFNRDVDLLHFAAGNVINEIAGSELQTFSFGNPKDRRELITILTMRGGYREDMAYRSLHLLKKVTTTLRELFGVDLLAGVGPLCAEVTDLAGSFDTALGLILDTDLLSLHGSAVKQAADEGRPPAKQAAFGQSLTSRLPLIGSALENGNTQHAKGILGELLKNWSAADAFPLGEADRMLQEFGLLLNDLLLEQQAAGAADKPASGDKPSRRAPGTFADFADFGQFAEAMQSLLDDYAERIRISNSVNRPFEAGDIKAYIDNHYFEDIKISVFAEKYFLSREYLMKLFKQQFGFGIHEYVQKVRMEKAKDLLGDASLKIQDISEMLGFKDKNYFSKAFRNYYSLSPSEYRDRQVEG